MSAAKFKHRSPVVALQLFRQHRRQREAAAAPRQYQLFTRTTRIFYNIIHPALVELALRRSMSTHAQEEHCKPPASGLKACQFCYRPMVTTARPCSSDGAPRNTCRGSFNAALSRGLVRIFRHATPHHTTKFLTYAARHAEPASGNYTRVVRALHHTILRCMPICKRVLYLAHTRARARPRVGASTDTRTGHVCGLCARANHARREALARCARVPATSLARPRRARTRCAPVAFYAARGTCK
eukprot:IDg12350t1